MHGRKQHDLQIPSQFFYDIEWNPEIYYNRQWIVYTTEKEQQKLLDKHRQLHLI